MGGLGWPVWMEGGGGGVGGNKVELTKNKLILG